MSDGIDHPRGNTHSRNAKARDLEARRAAARARARNRLGFAIGAFVVVVAVAVVLVVTLGSKSKPAAATAASGSGAGQACTYTTSGTPAKDVGVPPAHFQRGNYTATITTNRGVITVDLAGSKAPCTVNSFDYLASKGYFDDTPCHRLTTSGIFVLQCGDPTGTGSGGPGYKFGDENLAGATYPAGTVAMANAGPGTNGSQFFLVYKDTSLPPDYTPFGTITSGLDVLTAIAAKGTDNANGSGDGHPNEKVTITSLTVTPK